MSPEIAEQILKRLTSIEEKLDLHNNPSRCVDLAHAASEMRKARLTGDKVKIKAAALLVGSGRRR